jgi:hypothetical protein
MGSVLDRVEVGIKVVFLSLIFAFLGAVVVVAVSEAAMAQNMFGLLGHVAGQPSVIVLPR